MSPLSPQQRASVSSVGNTPTDQGSWWQKLLPTAGGILGGIGGAFVPVAGETGVGEIAGAAGGSALGQELENELTGSTGSTAGAAAEGGIGQGIGLGIGKLAGGALGGIGKVTAPKVAEEIPGATDVAYDPRIQAALTSGAARNNIAEANKYADTRDFMRTQGAGGTPEEWLNHANFATGSPNSDTGAYLSKYLNQFAGEQSPIADNALLPKLQSIHEGENSSVLEPAATDTAGKFVSNELGKALVTTPDNRQVYDPQKLLQTVKNIEGRYNSNPLAKNPEAQTTQGKQAEYLLLPQAKKAIEDTLYNRGGVNEAVANFKVSPELAAEIKSKAPSEQSGNYVIDALNNSQDAASLRSAQAPLVRASSLAKETLGYEQGPKPLAATAKEVAATQADQAGASHPAEDLLQSGLRAATGGPIAKAGLLAKLTGGITPTVNRAAETSKGILNAGPRGVTPLTAISQLGTHLPGMAAGNNGENAMMPVSQTNGLAPGMNPMNPTSSAPISFQDIRQAAMLSPEMLPFLQKAQQAQSAQHALGGLEEAYQGAGGGQGLGGGILNRLSAIIPGTAAHAYQQQRLAVASAIANATGQQLPTVLASLPEIMASPDVANQMFGTTGGEIAPMIPSGNAGVSPSVLGQMPSGFPSTPTVGF